MRDADDSRVAAQPESACDTSSLKPSPALSSSDLFCSPSTPLSFSFQAGERVAPLCFFPLRSRRIRAVTVFFFVLFLLPSPCGCLCLLQSVLMQRGLCCHQSRMYNLVTHHKNASADRFCHQVPHVVQKSAQVEAPLEFCSHEMQQVPLHYYCCLS